MKWKIFATWVGGAIILIYALKIARAAYQASQEKSQTAAIDDLLGGV